MYPDKWYEYCIFEITLDNNKKILRSKIATFNTLPKAESFKNDCLMSRPNSIFSIEEEFNCEYV